MSKKGTRALASATIMSLVLTSALSVGPVKAAPGQVTRTSGSDRYATAASVATANWKTSDNVVLVSGEGYADAVSATALAKQLNAPILLTTAGSLSSDAKAALSTLQAKNIYVVGGNASVSAAVRTELKASYSLVELQGANRYETNIAVAKKLVQLGVKADNVLLVGGEGFSDALSVAPVAAAKGQILLLGNNNADSMKSVIDFVKANSSKVTVVGTSNVIGDAMYTALGATDRVNGGASRFETNLNVLSKFDTDLKADKLFVANATGNGYADALVASALAGKTASPLVLVDVDGSAATTAAVNYIKGKATKTTDLNVVGGTGVVSDVTVTAINNAVNPSANGGSGTSVSTSSVSTIGLNQIKVVFSTQVDKDTAEDVTNYELDGTELQNPSTVYANALATSVDNDGTASLQSDNQTVIITLSKARSQFKNQAFTVKNSVMDVNLNNTVPQYDQNITFSDTAVPTVTSVSVNGNSKVTVQFSEPVFIPTVKGGTASNGINKFKINGQSVSNFGVQQPTDNAVTTGGGIQYGFNNGNTKFDNAAPVINGATVAGYWTDKVELYFDNALPTGTNTLEIPDGTDGNQTSSSFLYSASHFTIKDTKLDFTVNTVTDAPQITNVKGGTNGKLYVTFNRPMDKITAREVTNYKINGIAISGGYTVDFDDNSNDTVVKITGIAGMLNKNANTVNVSKNVTDSYGNKVTTDSDGYNVNFNVTDDTTKPTVTNINLIDSQTLRIKFSKDVSYTYATSPSNYKLLDSTGTDISNVIQRYNSTSDVGIKATNNLTSDTDTYDIKLSKVNALTDSKYTLTVKNIIDTVSTPNTMDDYTTTFTGKSDIAPQVIGIDANSLSSDSDTQHKVVVFFDRAMDDATLTNVANYYFKNSKGDSKSLPSSATISPAADDKSVTIQFPTNYHLYTTRSAGSTAPVSDLNSNTIASSDTNVVQFGITNVKDQGGNALDGVAKLGNIVESQYDSVGGPAVVGNTAKFTYDTSNVDDVKVQVQLTAALDTLNKDDFTVTDGTTTVAPDSGTISGKYVILTFKHSSNDASDPTTKINKIKAMGVAARVNVTATNSTDAAGRAIQLASGATSTDGIVNGLVAYDFELAPRTIAITNNLGYTSNWVAKAGVVENGTTDNTIDVVFDEAIDGSIIGNYDNDFIFSANGTKLSVVSQEIVGTSVRYHFDKSTFKATDLIAVRANGATNTIDIRDKEDIDGNYYVYVPTSDDLKVRTVQAIAGN